MATPKDLHLECVLKSHDIENNRTQIEAYRKKRDEIRQALKEKFKSEIYEPLNSGSLKKRTAINIKFDLDIIVPFKKVMNLEEMFENIFQYFNVEYRKIDPSLLGVNRQKVSIGLEFVVNSHVLKLDIVPGREINEYSKDCDLNLFVNEAMGVFQRKTYLKTNIDKQIQKIRDTEKARETIKFLKVWKRRNNQNNLKSFFLELIAIRAFDENKTLPSGRWERLKYTLEYIRDILLKEFTLIDPGNQSNDISKTLHGFEKQGISDSIKWMLTDIEKNETSLEKYFPINPEFPCATSKSNVYVIGTSQKRDQLPDNDFGNDSN